MKFKKIKKGLVAVSGNTVYGIPSLQSEVRSNRIFKSL